LYIGTIVLVVNVVRLIAPRIRAQMRVVVPYTVVLAETMIGPNGTRSAGPHQTWAARSDGSVVVVMGEADHAGRQIRFGFDVHVIVNDSSRAKSST
jgi:hypothetical protein